MKKMGKVAELKRGRSRRGWSKDNDSDDSDEDYIVEEDEDYMVEEEENLLSDDEGDEDDGEQHCGDSYNDDKLEDKFEDSGEEKEMTKATRSKRKGSDLAQKKFGTRASNNWKNTQRGHKESGNEDQTENFEVSEEKEEVSKVTRSKRKRSCLDRKKLHTKASNNRKNGHRETDDEDYNVEEEEDDDEDQTEKFNFSEEHEGINEVSSSKRRRRCLYQKKLRAKASNNRRNGHVEIGEEDYNSEEEEEEDDEDEDFTPDESVSVEEEDEEENEEEEDLLLVEKVKRKNKVTKRTLKQKSSDSKKKNSRRFKATTCKVVKRKKRKLGSEDDEDGADFEDGVSININRVRSGNMNKKPGRGKRKFAVQSDSDFVDSGPSEAEFTISEEERALVREANNIGRDYLTVALRSSGSNKIQDMAFTRRRKPFLTKGKEKVQEVKNEIVKQVCGICFSEEGKNIVRGTLNCCSHYFCFTCILEWSKVESRCPLCKQRFLTISKPAKANTGVDLEDVVLQIPERDQVYQPTEEEIRAYLDPYENVICTECHEGGDDVLMLLCDLCDSPAHTYCVGLGWDVPEGNWYCDGCKPVSLGSSNSQTQNSLTGQRNLFHRLSSFESIRDDFDGPLSTPSTPFQQGFFSFPSPRHFDGGIQAHPPRSGTGTGVVTVSGRRQIHRQIQSMFSNHRTRQAAEVLFGVSANNSHVNRSPSRQRTSLPARTQEIGTSYFTQLDEESQDLPRPPSMQFSPVSSNHLENQRVHGISLPGDSYIQGTYRQSNIATLHNDQLFHFSDTTDVGCDYHLSSSALGGGSFFLEEHVKSLVQNYLSSMSGALRLGADFLEDVEIKSIQTILAACGFQFHPTEVFPMPPQPVCTHIEDSLMHDSPIKGHCNSCFNNFAKEVVKTIMNSGLPPFLHVRN